MGACRRSASASAMSQRSGSSMQYRIWVTIDPLTGASYFGYPIYLSVYVDGSGVTSGYTMKAASPNRWSSAITYNSGWVTVTGRRLCAAEYTALQRLEAES